MGFLFCVHFNNKKEMFYFSTYTLKHVIDWHFKRICGCLIFLKAEGWERDLFALEGGLDKKKKREILT